MASGQADDPFSSVPHHSTRKGNDGEAHGLQTLADPLFTPQPLHDRVEVERKHRHRPPCRVAPEQPGRQPAPGQVTFQNTMGLFAFATPLPAPLHHRIPSNPAVGDNAKDLVPSPVGRLHGGKRQLHLILHPGQWRLSQRLSGGDESVRRPLFPACDPVRHEAHLRPLLFGLHPILACPTVHRLPLPLPNSPYRPLERRRHVHPHRKLDHPEALVLPFRAILQQLLLVPRRVRPQSPPPVAPASTRPTRRSSSGCAARCGAARVRTAASAYRAGRCSDRCCAHSPCCCPRRSRSL